MGTCLFWQTFARSRGAAAVALIWGLAEATLFFIVPDAWIGLLALFDWRAGVRAVAWAVLGAVIGGAIVYGAGTRLDAAESERILLAVPAISPAMMERVDAEMRQRGAASMVEGPLRGTPYKIYARAAGVQREPPAAFLLWSIPARGVRFLLVAGVAAILGADGLVDRTLRTGVGAVLRGLLSDVWFLAGVRDRHVAGGGLLSSQGTPG